MENGTKDILIDMLLLKERRENVQTIHGRLDTLIDKLTDVSTSIKQMLAVHEEKSPDKNKQMKLSLTS